jgi:miniconductance mechanosensitive channel
MNYLEDWTEALLTGAGISGEWAIYLRLIIFVMVLIVISALSFFITRHIIISNIYKLVRKTRITWDDAIADQGVFNNLAHIVPAIFIRLMAPGIFADFDSILPMVVKITDVYLIIVGSTILLAFLKVLEIWLSSFALFKEKPLTSYFQLIKIIIYIVVFILILSLLLGKSPLYFLSAFGAMTAILLLIFKDTILGLVASVQISSNDMVKVGDWVEMPKFNADGDVIEISLHTVKVQNWDRTITTIPTYFFITDSFKNWRGMVQSGGRRIKRSLFINAQTIQFIDPETRELYKKYQLMADYIEQRQKEIEAFNSANEIDTSVLINGRRMTNLGVFRKYIENYLRNHPKIKQDMIIMVRQLAAEDRGIPLEIYCFTNTTAWVEYEAIQSDIFDHLFSAVHFFGLDIFQQPSGKDILQTIEAFRQGSHS